VQVGVCCYDVFLGVADVVYRGVLDPVVGLLSGICGYGLVCDGSICIVVVDHVVVDGDDVAVVDDFHAYDQEGC